MAISTAECCSNKYNSLEIRALPNGGYLVRQHGESGSYCEYALAGFTTVGEALKWVSANIKKAN